MANYTDKVIKSLESENIKKLKSWNKDFTSKFDEDELKTVLRLSESIDKLWKLTADERKKIEEATYEPLSVYGHEESGEGSHKTIRERVLLTGCSVRILLVLCQSMLFRYIVNNGFQK